MPQPFGIRDVVGGRYRITHHVVTSADQDIIFQATDQVLGRQVSVLLASRANAKQVATSAKELAAGARDSEVEVLDLGLVEDRTFLISSMVDPNQLLDLVVPDAAPYVEPYYTDSLGSELFGQSREIAPHTYDDDAEYYARLHGGLSGRESQPGRRSRRPGFLDKVTPGHRRTAAADEPSYSRAELESELESAGTAHGLSISQEIARVHFSLRTDLELVAANPAADSEGELIEAFRAAPAAQPPERPVHSAEQPDPASADQPQESAPADDEHFGAALPGGPLVESSPSAALSTVAVGANSQYQASVGVSDLQAEGEEVVDNPPAEPDLSYDRPGAPEESAPEAAGYPPALQGEPDPGGPTSAFQEPGSFTSLISAVPSGRPSAFPSADDSPAVDGSEPLRGQGTSVPLTRWVAIGILAVLILAAAIVVFLVLTG